MELYVFLNRSEMPSPEAWQEIINDCKFDLEIDRDFDVFSFTGLLPCIVGPRSTGFEYYFAPKEEVAGSSTYLAPLTKAFDSVVIFRWEGDLLELAAVMSAAGSLASSRASLLYFPDDDSTVLQSQALGYAREQLKQMDGYLKR
ncbi:MAG TPA: hypothetical protein VGN16_17380 [Acidobacteriaceae bacterium]